MSAVQSVLGLWGRIADVTRRVFSWVRTRPTEIATSVVEDHKGVRRALVVWSAWLITWTVFRVFHDVGKINGDVVAALTAVIGVLTTSIGFYHFSRNKQDGGQ